MEDYERVLRTHFERPLKGKQLTEIQTHQFMAIIDKLQPTKAECNYAFAVARRFFRWAVSRRAATLGPHLKDQPPAQKNARRPILTQTGPDDRAQRARLLVDRESASAA
jgi:hypothetical protein